MSKVLTGRGVASTLRRDPDMNPLPRFLGTALFVVLAILAALLAAPLWQRPAPAATPPVASAAAAPNGAAVPALNTQTARVARLSQRVALGLALFGLVLAAGLIFSLAIRPGSGDTRPPFATARQELGTLAQLAQTSAAQGAELNRERDERRRAEEDARLKQELLSEALEEKIRIGQDLHDGIIQSLYAVGLNLESMRPLLPVDPTQAERRLDEVRASLNGAIRDVRAYITGLAPDNLRRASFSRGVAVLFEQMRAGRTAEIEIKVDDAAAIALTLEQNIEALQIAREAISNALRHGGATHIRVRMHQGDGAIGLLVQDDGRGFDPNRTSTSGHGLTNMQARAARLGANLRIISAPGEGTRVIANFPLHPAVA